MGGTFDGRRYLRGKIKKSKIKKCGRDIAWDVFRWDFYHKKKNSGLMAFRNLQNFRLRRQKMKKTNEIQSNFAVMSKEQEWMKGDIGGFTWIKVD